METERVFLLKRKEKMAARLNRRVKEAVRQRQGWGLLTRGRPAWGVDTDMIVTDTAQNDSVLSTLDSKLLQRLLLCRERWGVLGKELMQ